MELQGKKKTRDFLSLYTKESSFQLHDSKPSPQGFFTKAPDFLQPLETAEKEKEKKRPAERTSHVLPGGFGTYSISQVSAAGGGGSTLVPVKPEAGTCGTEPSQRLDPAASRSSPAWDTAGSPVCCGTKATQ